MGRVRTLSTPKLLALEHEEAEVIIGDRIGYRVTTTINQVTTESIEFLESGIILNVQPYVDRNGRIMMDIHPEVSTGTITNDGMPNQTTTEVTTQLLADDGQTIFYRWVDAQHSRRPPCGRTVDQQNTLVRALVPEFREKSSSRRKRSC